MKHAAHVAGIMLLIAALIYIGICGFMFATQRSMIYYPQPRANQSGIALMTIETTEGPVLASTRPVAGADALIYFGGNAEDVSLDMPDLAKTFPNFAIYLLHYPGYGGSLGKPTEKTLFAAGLALFDQVHEQHQNIVVIGRSLGTGVAVYVASQRPVARLVLVTPFDSLGDVAAKQDPYLPSRLLLLDKFDSGKYAPQINAPTRILEAENDEIVPRESTELLLSRLKKGIATMVVVPHAGHNTISDSPEYWSLLKGQ
jgi:uncharacterized protein